MTSIRSPQKVSGRKSGVTNPLAPAPAFRNRLAKLEKKVAEVTGGAIRDVLGKSRRLRYKIEEFNRRFDTFACTSETLGDLKVKVYRHEAERVELRRQVELSSAPSPPLNQQAGNDRFPIPIYSGERSTLPNFLKTFLRGGSIVPGRGDLESGLVCVEELNRSLDGTNGSHALAAGFKSRSGGQSWWSEGRGSRNSGGRGKSDGRGCPPNQRQPQHQPRHQHEQPAHRQRHQQHQRQVPQQQYQWYHPRHQVQRPAQHSGVHHACVSGVVSTGILCQSAAQYPLYRTRVFLARTWARKLPRIHILETTPLLRADVLRHCSQPPRRLIRMDRSFRLCCPRVLSSTRPP